MAPHHTENHVPRTGGQKLAHFMRQNLLVFLMLLSLGLGIVMGVGIRERDPPFTKRENNYLRFPGDLFLNMLKMLILPLVVSSLIAGVAGLDMRSSKWIGARAVIYYMVTTIMAVILGIVLVVAIQPGYRGKAKEDRGRSGNVVEKEAQDTILDLVRNIFPPNLVRATFGQHVTIGTDVTNESAVDYNETDPRDYTWKIEFNSTDNMNVLGLVVFSIFVGAILSHMRERGRPLVAFFECLNEVTMILVHLAIWFAPVGIMFLIAHEVVQMKDPEETLKGIGLYMATVLTGLVIHGYIILPIIYFIATRKNPFKFIYRMLQPLVTAFSTASSSATLPITMRTLEEKHHIDRRIIRFMTPIGATINMDGTALYEAVAAIFIAQLNDKTLYAADIILISLTATLAAIGAAGVPQAGLVTMIIVLTAINLPTEDITMILAVDWFLDRCRTSVNVLGDGFGAGVVAHLSKKDIEKMDRFLEEDAHGENHVNHALDMDGDIHEKPSLESHDSKL